MWLFQNFVKKSGKDAIYARRASVDKKLRGKDIVNNLLHTYDRDDIIYETYDDINRSNQGDHMFPPEY